jgi:ribonuclease Z
MSRRRALTIFCTGVVLLSSLLPVTGGAQSLKVTLLGTGTPVPRIDRFGPSTLVQTDRETFLFDCGRGAAQRIFQLRMPLGQVTDLFITHLHSDHVVGIPDFWLTGWIPVFGGRKTPLRVWGPVGTKEMVSSLEKAFQADYRIRTEDEKYPPEGYTMIAQDIKEGVIFEKNGVKITAFEVEHFPVKIEPCLGYRIDYAGRSVVLSGDTRYSENLIRFSKGTDVLVHEVAAAKEEMLSSPWIQRIMAHHTSPEEAGKVFTQVKPKMAVYTHLVLIGPNPMASPTPADVITMTRKTYSGPLEIGQDLMVIEVGDEVKVSRPSR